jgi:hypothetical protein
LVNFLMSETTYRLKVDVTSKWPPQRSSCLKLI